MTDQEFIDYAICKPYEKLADGPDAFDCWGLVVDYFRKVRGVELKLYDHGELETGFFAEVKTGRWREGSGVVFMAFDDTGTPAHCGLLFGNKVLHASGDQGLGQVTLHPLRVIRKFFKDMTVYDYCQA